MGIIERKKSLGSAAKNRDGRMVVNKHTFFWPYTFRFASFISFGLIRPRKNIVVTCVSGSLRKELGSVGQHNIFYFIFSVCAKNLRSVGEPETHFSWPYLQECILPLHNARPTLKKVLFPHTRQYKKEKGQWNMLFLKEGKRILKHATQKDTNLTDWNSLKCFKTIWI